MGGRERPARRRLERGRPAAGDASGVENPDGRAEALESQQPVAAGGLCYSGHDPGGVDGHGAVRDGRLRWRGRRHNEVGAGRRKTEDDDAVSTVVRFAVTCCCCCCCRSVWRRWDVDHPAADDFSNLHCWAFLFVGFFCFSWSFFSLFFRVDSPADRPDWSYALGIMGERDLFDEDDGVGPASCCPELLPKKEVRHMRAKRWMYIDDFWWRKSLNSLRDVGNSCLRRMSGTRAKRWISIHGRFLHKAFNDG